MRRYHIVLIFAIAEKESREVQFCISSDTYAHCVLLCVVILAKCMSVSCEHQCQEVNPMYCFWVRFCTSSYFDCVSRFSLVHKSELLNDWQLIIVT